MNRCKIRPHVTLGDLARMTYFHMYMDFKMKDLVARINFHELVLGINYTFNNQNIALVYFNSKAGHKCLMMYDLEQFMELFEDA